MSRILDFSDGFTSNVEPTSEALPAANVSNTPSGNLSATNAQLALNELQGDIDTINAKVGAVNGIATLDSNGKVPTTQMPALALTDVYVVADIAARNALTVEEGDVAKVTDNGSGSTCTYVYDGSSWVEIQADAQLALHEADTSTHGVSGAILGTSDAQVITNKDIDGGTASNSRRFTLPKDTLSNLQALTRKEGGIVYATDSAKPYFDNGSALVAVGSGSGSGAKNYILNPDAETDTTGYSLYSDAAGSAPVDGSGGSVNTGTEINWSRTTSSPLSETASFLFSKIATSSMQGKGVSYDFTINRADQAKVCRIDFDYEVASGTYADGDLTVWLYDVTNAQLIQPSASSILNAVGPQKKQPLSFQTNSNSTSYRLIIHVASTSASAYTVKFDSVSVVRESVSQGTVVTDWVAYTPTLTNGTNVSVTKVSWRQVGDSVEILGYLSVTGAGSGADLAVSMPSGIVMDTGKINGSANNHVLGSGEWLDNGTGRFVLMPVYASTTVFSFQKQQIGGLQGSDLASGDAVSFTLSAPIVGWSSSQQLSSDADTREVSAKYSLTSNETTAANADHIMTNFTTKVYDSHGCISGSRFTAPVPGRYEFEINLLTLSATWAANDTLVAWVGKNGATQTEIIHWERPGVVFTDRYFFKGSVTLNLLARDTVDLNIRNNTGGGTVPIIDSTGAVSTWAVKKVSGPAQIAASEEVSAKRYSSSTAAVYNSATTVAWTTSDYDSHGGFGTSSVYTVKTPGKYQVTARVNLASVSASAVERIMYVQISQNSTVKAYSPVDRAYSTTGREYSQLATTTLNCVVGDTIDIQVFQNLVTSTNVNNNGGGMADNFVCIERIG